MPILWLDKERKETEMETITEQDIHKAIDVAFENLRRGAVTNKYSLRRFVKLAVIKFKREKGEKNEKNSYQ